MPTATSTSLHELKFEVGKNKPHLAKVLEKFGSMTLAEYTSKYFDYKPNPIDDPKDIAKVSENYARKILGNKYIKTLKKRFQNTVFTTADHHRPHISSIALQGDIIFALNENEKDIFPILSFADIPLNNVTYPQGIVLSRKTQHEQGHFSPIRIPVHPNKFRHSLVSVTGPYKSEMVHKAIAQTKNLLANGRLIKSEADTTLKILNDIYLDNKILNLENLSDQIVAINDQLWEALFSDNIHFPHAIMLEIERICTDLLELDFENPNSLSYNTFFNDEIRNSILKNLSGFDCCWNNSKLEALLNPNLSRSERHKLESGSQSMFFWGIDKSGQRIPLLLQDQYLRGRNRDNELFEIKFNKESIIAGLKNKRLVPTLYTSFLPITFARGAKCFGGFLQTDYLTNMRDQLALALTKGGKKEWADKIKTIPTDNFTTGMVIILAEYPDGNLFPGGGIEIIASGGITQSMIKQIRNIKVLDATVLSLPTIYRRVVPEKEQKDYLLKITTKDIYESTEGIVKLKL